MVTFKCVSCGSPISVEDGTEVCICGVCKTKQFVPSNNSTTDSSVPIAKPVEENANQSPVDILLKRGFALIEDRRPFEASRIFDEALNQDPDNWQAYMGKFMVKADIPVFSSDVYAGLFQSTTMKNGKKSFSLSDIRKERLIATNFLEKAIQRTDQEMKRKIMDVLGPRLCNDARNTLNRISYFQPKYYSKLEPYLNLVRDYNETADIDKEASYRLIIYYSTNKIKDIPAVYSLFDKVGEYKNSEELYVKIVYRVGKQLQKEGKYQEAITEYEKIQNSKDVKKEIAKCKARLCKKSC